MHVYICPYCDPSPKSNLIKIKEEKIGCKYNNEKDCIDKHKCKETMQCKVCKNQFKVTKAFLREQKRKIKDG